jgi:hypothetical protein
MSSQFRKRFIKLAEWFGGLFILLFVFRIIYGYYSPERSEDYSDSGDYFSSVGNVKKNYASEKFRDVRLPDIQGQADAASVQKYEKTALVNTKSTEFEKDEQKIRSVSKSYNAVIQYERKLGNKGNRALHLLVGIDPSQFDSFYVKVRTIGKLKATEITKVDKTNEYRQLNAKKTSLENTLNSLNELKSRSGQITDFVALHDKILEVESSLQELGVELGNFDKENEFCTVRFSLFETAAVQKITFLYRVKVALEWTIEYFTLSMVAVVLSSLSIFIILLIIDRLKILKSISGDNKTRD